MGVRVHELGRWLFQVLKYRMMLNFLFFFLLKCIRIVPVKAIAVCAWVYTGTYCTLFFCESNAGQFESANIYFTDYHGDHFNQL